MKIIIAVIAFLILTVSARAQPPLRLTTVHRNLSYVTNGHERNKLDLYLPSPPAVRAWEKPPKEGYKRKLPLVIWIHGGAFFVGSKDDTVPLELLSEGYAVAGINYRLSRDAKFPEQIEDCKAAVRWLRANAAKYGLDAERFAAFGESAGGYLAAMLGTTGDIKEFDVGENLEQSSRVQAVVDFYGPTDFLQNAFAVANPKSPEAQLIGGAILENKDKAAKANPIAYVTRDAAPFLVVHGDADKLVPYNQSELLAAALKKANVPVQLYAVKGGGHGDFDYPQIRRLISEFLARTLKKK
ncbi:MAG: alpha/beta hydrolase [Acidobacteria bacterium]|nr:alpha/beta hydrolase [Acidobacteriota bacterium]